MDETLEALRHNLSRQEDFCSSIKTLLISVQEHHEQMRDLLAEMQYEMKNLKEENQNMQRELND